MFTFRPSTGVHIELEDFYEMSDRGIVYVGKIVGLPDGKTSIGSDDLRKALIGQVMFYRKIKAVELFAVQTQYIGRGVGMLLDYEREV